MEERRIKFKIRMKNLSGKIEKKWKKRIKEANKQRNKPFHFISIALVSYFMKEFKCAI